MRWLWVVVPTLLVGAAAGLIHAVASDGFILFGLLAIAIVGLGHVLTDLRRREEPPVRPGFEFFASPPLVAARAGRAFALAATVAAAALFAGIPTVALLAGVPACVGVSLVTRLVRGASVLRLSPGGVEVRGRRYTWEALTSVELNGDRAVPRLDLVVAGERRPVTLRPAGVDASLLFLMDLLGYYQTHGSARAAIGDPAEAVRVHGLLLSARLAAGLHGGPRPILLAR
ncbi:hypothetical protein ACQP00_03640 [Dactylosporangium sp. CS-047395]|uniref:hypothetical protein n=1 Tax=Dactylosporangium sp. CS-047395 TaxID=3239936 RepID=UPI003D8B2A8B